MKKIIVLSVSLLLIAVTASAQRPNSSIRRPGFNRGSITNQLTLRERLDVRKDALRYRMTERRALRDGVVNPVERRRMHKMKKQNRRQLFRYNHNSRQRLI